LYIDKLFVTHNTTQILAHSFKNAWLENHLFWGQKVMNHKNIAAWIFAHLRVLASCSYKWFLASLASAVGGQGPEMIANGWYQEGDPTTPSLFRIKRVTS